MSVNSSKLLTLPLVDDLIPSHAYHILEGGVVQLYITSNSGVPYPVAGSTLPVGYASTPSLGTVLGGILPDFGL